MKLCVCLPLFEMMRSTCFWQFRADITHTSRSRCNLQFSTKSSKWTRKKEWEIFSRKFKIGWKIRFYFWLNPSSQRPGKHFCVIFYVFLLDLLLLLLLSFVTLLVIGLRYFNTRQACWLNCFFLHFHLKLFFLKSELN